MGHSESVQSKSKETFKKKKGDFKRALSDKNKDLCLMWISVNSGITIVNFGIFVKTESRVII